MKGVVYINANNEVLRWAREAFALSRANAASSTGISVKRLQQIEDGEKHPNFDELKAMSKTYKRTIATLLLKEQPKEKPLPSDRRTVDSKEVGLFHEKTILAVRKARALAQSYYELREDTGLTTKNLDLKATLQDKPESVAHTIRQKMELDSILRLEHDNDVLDTLTEKIGSFNIAVFQLSLTQDNIRGFSLTDETIPVIVIKRGGESPSAKIFTLFHELGHIILNEGGICDNSFETSTLQIEKWCNAFAAEILIPSEELLARNLVLLHKKNNNKDWSKKELIELATYFHSGPLSILRRLLEHDLTTLQFYKEKHLAWNKPSFGRAAIPEGRNIPKEAIKEKGRVYMSLAFKAFDQNRIDIKDLSDLLGMKLSYIPRTRQLLNV
jgi:Zn-dependent peptidase ImmA (M78 family)/transcriptional regulator with XRE-family HTH domain